MAHAAPTWPCRNRNSTDAYLSIGSADSSCASYDHCCERTRTVQPTAAPRHGSFLYRVKALQTLRTTSVTSVSVLAHDSEQQLAQKAEANSIGRPYAGAGSKGEYNADNACPGRG